MLPHQILREDDGNKVSVAVTIDGRIHLADQDHPNFEQIYRGAVLGDLSDRDLRDLFDITVSIGQRFETVPGASRLTISNGHIYFDHEEIDNALTDQILRFYQEGVEFSPLIQFFDKVQANPNPHSKEHAYKWLHDHNFTILPDGDIVAYKGVGSDWMSVNSGRAIVDGVVVEGRIPNRPGSVIEMPRDEVVFAPGGACHIGLHVATYSFARTFGHGHTVMVRVNPADIVSVPNEVRADKMRVCRYEISHKVDEEFTGPLWEDDDHETDSELAESVVTSAQTCPECGYGPVTVPEPGSVPVCLNCDWTGWPEDTEDAPVPANAGIVQNIRNMLRRNKRGDA